MVRFDREPQKPAVAFVVLKVEFRDFWAGFDSRGNAFSDSFTRLGNIEVVDTGGDVCIYSCFGASHHTFKGCKVFVTAENLRPNFRDADFCIGFDHSDDHRYLRSPNWARGGVGASGLLRPYGDNIKEEPTEFCAFVVSNPWNPIRNQIFKELSQHRYVHSPGQVFRNDSINVDAHASHWDTSAVDYLRRFQFTIAAENSSYPGYTTEKLKHAFLAGSIPIYWGDPLVNHDFDPQAFLNFDDYGSVSALVQAVLELAEDPAAMERMRSIAPLSQESWERSANPYLMDSFFERVFEVGGSPSYRRPAERREPSSRAMGLVHEVRAAGLAKAKGWRRRLKVRLLNRAVLRQR